jgi:hypothetical protein
MERLTGREAFDAMALFREGFCETTGSDVGRGAARFGELDGILAALRAKGIHIS